MRFLGGHDSAPYVRRSVIALGVGLLGSLTFLFDCGGSSFSGASAGGAGTNGGGAGGIGQAGSTAAGFANGGAAGIVARGGAANGGSSDGESGEAGESPGGDAGAAGVSAAGTGGASTAGTGGASTAGTGGAVSGGAGGQPASACPATAPNSGACVSGLTCTYGSDLRPACRSRVDCVSGRWVVSGVACAPLIDCLDQDGGVPHPGDVCTQVGDDCTLGNEAQGGPVYCRCDACVGATCSPQWDCIGPPLKPCTAIPPNEGQACDTNAQSCSYGSCGMPANDVETLQCVDHFWQRVGGGCVSAG